MKQDNSQNSITYHFDITKCGGTSTWHSDTEFTITFPGVIIGDIHSKLGDLIVDLPELEQEVICTQTRGIIERTYFNCMLNKARK